MKADASIKNPVTLTFDLLTERLMHAERLLCALCLATLVLIARAGFYTYQRNASAVYAVFVCPSVCLSVCPSEVGVLPKRLNVGSRRNAA